MSRAVSRPLCLRNAIAFLLLLFGAAILALYPDWFNRPLAIAISSFGGDRQVSNALALGLAYPTLQGVVVVSLLWCCWFSSIKAELRARLAGGAFAAVFAGFVAHILNRILPTSPKPIFDPAIDLHVPSVVDKMNTLGATSFVGAHTFPSERATLFAGLAIAIFLVRPRLGLIALGCTMAPELSRIYLGLHNLNDIIGSLSLAAALVWIAQIEWGSELGFRLIRWETSSAATFYMCAFVASYQIADGFQALRELAALFFR
jgi:membrane-associated phospholipid phosphatase